MPIKARGNFTERGVKKLSKKINVQKQSHILLFKMHNFNVKIKQKGSVAVSKKGLFFNFLNRIFARIPAQSEYPEPLRVSVYLINIVSSFDQREIHQRIVAYTQLYNL